MEFTKEQIQDAVRHAASERWGQAPRPVVQAALSLGLGADVTLWHVDARMDDHESVWKLLWLTEQGLLYVEAQKASSNWYNSVSGDADRLTGWLRPLSTLTSIDLTGTSQRGMQYGTGWEFTSRYSLAFADGTTLEVPLFGEDGSSRDAFQGEHLVAVLLRR